MPNMSVKTLCLFVAFFRSLLGLGHIRNVFVAQSLVLICLSVSLERSVVAESQNVIVYSGTNFVGINVKVEDNEVGQLFPDAPVGTLIFAFDNASGFVASQMTSSGWSQPSMRIAPLSGAIMILPG